MLTDVIEVRILSGLKLFLTFEDGTSGEVDLETKIKFNGIFSLLLDPVFFAQVTVNKEAGTIVWPNGADLCPDVLYTWIKENSKKVA